MKKEYDVVLLTEPRYENPQNPDWYVCQILHEDELVITALESKGLRVCRVDWSRSDFDWSSTRLAVFRTTWDYFNRFEEFSVWLDYVSKQTSLLNPYQLIRWNLNKRYLLDLAAKGIRIPPTQLVEKGSFRNLDDYFSKWNCTELIIKPCVGGTARHTYRINGNNVSEHQAILDRLSAQEDMLIQPFLTSITERGEISALMFGGEFSHAVLKKAKTGDFRVQDDFGGTVYPYDIAPEEKLLAEQAVRACLVMPAYARVDIIYDHNDQPAISELEIVEPELFFRFRPEAAGLLAGEIAGALY